jgi:hypothetical protein
LYGVIQSGLTSAIAAAIASFDFLTGRSFLIHWLHSWLIAWVLMLPIVLFAAPIIRRLTLFLAQEDHA